MIAVLPRKSTGIIRMNYRTLNLACKEEEWEDQECFPEEVNFKL